MEARRKAAAIAGACLTAVLVSVGAYYYHEMGTPEYSLSLFSQAVQNHDLEGAKQFYDTEAISDAAVSYVVNSERQRWLPSAGSASEDSIVIASFWRSYELSARSSMRDAAEASLRQLVESSTATKPDNSFRTGGTGFDIKSVDVQGRIADVIVSRADGRLVIDSPYGHYGTMTFRMRETTGHRWKVVEVKEIDQVALAYTRDALSKLGLNPNTQNANP